MTSDHAAMAHLTNYALLPCTLSGVMNDCPHCWRHATIVRWGPQAEGLYYLQLDDGNGLIVRVSWLAEWFRGGQFQFSSARTALDSLVGERASYRLRWNQSREVGIINQHDWIGFDNLVIGEKHMYGAP